MNNFLTSPQALTVGSVLLGIDGIGCKDDDDEPIAGWPAGDGRAGA